MKKPKFIERAIKSGFAIEDTGGGCQWLRKDRIVITDGEASLPRANEPCRMYTLDVNDNADEGQDFESLDAALAFLNASNRIYRVKA